jgi:hypothetical protein
MLAWPRLSAVLLGCLLLSFAAPAAADEFEECQKAYSENKFQEAYICYQKGYEKSPSFRWAANLGNVEVKLGKYKDAIPHLEYALDHVDPTLPDPELTRRRLREKIAEATSKVAVVTFSLTPANTSGATVAINGNVIGTTPLAQPIILDAGTYTLTATHPRFEDLSYQLQAQPGTSPKLNLPMRPRTTPKADGGVSPALIGVAVAGGVLALGALGAGIGLHVAASGKSDDREALAAEIGDNSICADPANTDVRCDQVQSLADDENTFSTTGTALLVVGGALAVGTVLAVVLWPSSSSETASLWVAPGAGSLTVGGTF